MDELRPLIDAATERAQPWLERMAAASAASASGDGTDHPRPVCDWCPVCAAVAVARGEHSELAARAAEHVMGLLAVLRAAFADAEHAGGCCPAGHHDHSHGERGSARTGEASSAEQSSPRVQRITVRRRPASGQNGEAVAEEFEC